MNYIRKRITDRKRCQELREKIDFLKGLGGAIDVRSPYYVDVFNLKDYEQELESLI
jgi:hypothetical protein